MNKNILILAVACTLAGCTTATPYQPLTPSTRGQGGYSDMHVERNRYRVTFAGNSMTSRETVERYLLYRAAELTRQHGFDWFVMADRNTERRSRTYVDRPFTTGPYGYWGPSWRYRGAGFGWRTWDPFWGDPFWDRGIDVTTVHQYEATAEIVMRHGPTPRNNPRAFDAQDILANLGPSVQRPQ